MTTTKDDISTLGTKEAVGTPNASTSQSLVYFGNRSLSVRQLVTCVSLFLEYLKGSNEEEVLRGLQDLCCYFEKEKVTKKKNASTPKPSNRQEKALEPKKKIAEQAPSQDSMLFVYDEIGEAKMICTGDRTTADITFQLEENPRIQFTLTRKSIENMKKKLEGSPAQKVKEIKHLAYEVLCYSNIKPTWFKARKNFVTVMYNFRAKYNKEGAYFFDHPEHGPGYLKEYLIEKAKNARDVQNRTKLAHPSHKPARVDLGAKTDLKTAKEIIEKTFKGELDAK